MIDSSRDQSEFNMAVSYLNRINNLFYVAGNASISLDMYTWYHSLQVLFRELSTEMRNEEIELWEAESDTMHLLLAKHLKRADSGIPGISPELYKRMHKFEMFLRKIMKESGLQTKMMNDPRLAK